MTKISKGHGISIETFGDLISEGYRMTAHCSNCREFFDIDLTKFPADRSYIGYFEHCACGKRLKCQISPVDVPQMSRGR